MAKNVFYAWQSDRPKNLTREFISTAIDAAIKRLNTEVALQEADDIDQLEKDQDTQGFSGSPPIAETICKKIDQCAAFVADLTFVSDYTNDSGVKKKSCNGNVVIELGYARGRRGLEYIVTVQNTFYGKPELLPFDLRHLRHPIKFRVSEDMSDENKARAHDELTADFENALGAVMKTVLAAEKRELIKKAAGREGEITAAHSAFVGKSSKGEFHGVTGSMPMMLVSVIPLVKPAKPLDLTAKSPQLKRMLSTVKYTASEHFRRAGSYITRYVSPAVGVSRPEPYAATEITEDGCIFSAYAILTEGPELDLHEGQLMHAGGDWLRLLMLDFMLNPPLKVGITLLNAKGSTLRALSKQPIPASPITPKLCLLEGVFDASDYGTAVTTFAKIVRPCLDHIWQEAGLDGDPHYMPNGDFRGY